MISQNNSQPSTKPQSIAENYDLAFKHFIKTVEELTEDLIQEFDDELYSSVH